jgi:hypothetical protein
MRSSGSRAIRENRPNGLHVSKRPQDSRRLPCRCPGHSGFDARQPAFWQRGAGCPSLTASAARAQRSAPLAIEPGRGPTPQSTYRLVCRLGVGQRLPNARELATSRMTVRTVDGCQPLAQDLVGTARLTSLPDTISSSHRSVPNKFQHKSRRHLPRNWASTIIRNCCRYSLLDGGATVPFVAG